MKPNPTAEFQMLAATPSVPVSFYVVPYNLWR